MKTREELIWFGMMVMALLATACGQNPQNEEVVIPATGDIVTERYDMDGFDEVEVDGFFEAVILQGEAFDVQVEAERALMPYLEVSVRGDRLSIGLKAGVRFNFEEASQQVVVKLPKLSRAIASNHSTMQVNGLEAEGPLTLEVLDFSSMRGSIKAKDLQIVCANHSTLILIGSASEVAGEVMDFSSADLIQLDSSQVDVTADEKSTLTQ